MADELHIDFLNSSDAYMACVEHWNRKIASIASSLGQTGEWNRWIPLHFADGTPMEKDGNPIYDGRSKVADRAFRIMQDRGTANGSDICAWVKTYDEEFREMPRSELFISLRLTEHTDRIATSFLQKWMTRTTSIDEMKSFIRSLGCEV